MKCSLRKIGLWSLLTLVCGITSDRELKAQSYSSENIFYLLGSPESYRSFLQHAGQISIVCPDTYQIDSVGVIAGQVDPRVLVLARAKGVRVMPLFNYFDQQGIHVLLNSPSARKEAIRLMLFEARKYHYYGWQFDLENIYFTDQDAYTSFFIQTADSLHRYGFHISSAIVKSDQPAPETGNSSFQRYMYEHWSGAFDIPAIAAAADFISFMTYDQHMALTPPGPVAGMPWLRTMLQYLLNLGIPPQKISLGIPTYSDHWYPTWNPPGGARSTRDEISYASAMDLLNRYRTKTEWLPKQQVSMAHWEEGGVFNWLFLEDAASFLPKFELAKQNRLLGISVWVLGTEDPGIWKVLKQEAGVTRVP